MTNVPYNKGTLEADGDSRVLAAWEGSVLTVNLYTTLLIML
jgi:hypothetical protein